MAARAQQEAEEPTSRNHWWNRTVIGSGTVILPDFLAVIAPPQCWEY
jgi:hypothetical protein